MKDFIEIERKFIIEMPKRDELLALDFSSSSFITQIYLSAPEGITRRIRSRSYKTKTHYFETIKKRIDKISAYEDEREISESEFVEKSKEIREGSKPITKERITFPYKSHSIEIDIYPEWKNTAIMEIELKSREEKVEIPCFIKIIKEVTGERKYTNAAMSESFPKEEK